MGSWVAHVTSSYHPLVSHPSHGLATSLSQGVLHHELKTHQAPGRLTLRAELLATRELGSTWKPTRPNHHWLLEEQSVTRKLAILHHDISDTPHLTSAMSPLSARLGPIEAPTKGTLTKRPTFSRGGSGHSQTLGRLNPRRGEQVGHRGRAALVPSPHDRLLSAHCATRRRVKALALRRPRSRTSLRDYTSRRIRKNGPLHTS